MPVRRAKRFSARGRDRGNGVDVASAVREAFAARQAYMPMDRLSRFLEEGEPITGEDIVAACNESGQYRVQGKLILRT